MGRRPCDCSPLARRPERNRRAEIERYRDGSVRCRVEARRLFFLSSAEATQRVFLRQSTNEGGSVDVQDEAALLEVRAKNAAANFLRKRSYEIVERDWRCSEGGADIVARREGAFVFAEVVSQNGNEPFEEESVASTEKGERIKAACTFMRERGEGGGEMRFETVLVTFFDKDRRNTCPLDRRMHQGLWRPRRPNLPSR